MSQRPEAIIELRHSRDGCCAKAEIEGASEELPRIFGGVFATRDEAISEATTWTLGWLGKLTECSRSGGRGVG